METALLTSPERESFEVTPEDRRRSERVPQFLPAWISGDSVDRAGPGQHVNLNDLSIHGVGFSCEGRYRVGAVHWVVVNGPSVRISSRIRIVSCRENVVGGFDVGAMFF